MNLAFRPGTDTWFIFCYRTRFAYDAKWEPRKPSRSDSIGETLDVWRTEAKDQVSSCAFGETKDIWFMRSTDTATEWHPEPGPSVPRKALIEFHKALKRQDVKKKRNGEEVQFTKLRAVTFGPNKTWILYSKDTFQWSEHGLPETLIQALTLGQMNKWIINVSELSTCASNSVFVTKDYTNRKSFSTHAILMSMCWYTIMVLCIARFMPVFRKLSRSSLRSGVRVCENTVSTKTITTTMIITG